MSNRIFTISGNYRLRGKWETPDPSFVGKIVMRDDDTFVGYCDELYAADTPDINRVRYLTGAYADYVLDKDCYGIAFYKLSNYPAQVPLMYVDFDLLGSCLGSWGAYNENTGHFETSGKATLKLIEEPYSAMEERRIFDKYNELRGDIEHNAKTLKMIDRCKDLLWQSPDVKDEEFDYDACGDGCDTDDDSVDPSLLEDDGR